MIRRHSSKPLRRQRGAALFVSLILLLVLTLIGVTAAQMQTVEERMALNDDNHQLALQSGEAVLIDSMDQFLNSDYNFNDTNGVWNLTWEPNSGGLADQWSAFSTNGAQYNGPTLSGVPVSAPYVLVESLPPISTGNLSNSTYEGQTPPVARTTTVASGGDSTSQVVVQSDEYNPPEN